MRGEGRSSGVSANEYSCTHWAQINFGDLTPYLTYDFLGTPRHYLATPHISNNSLHLSWFRSKRWEHEISSLLFCPATLDTSGTIYFFSWIGHRDGNTRFLVTFYVQLLPHIFLDRSKRWEHEISFFFMTYIKTFFSGCINKWNINIQYRITSIKIVE